jgi:hypothetical protein
MSRVISRNRGDLIPLRNLHALKFGRGGPPHITIGALSLAEEHVIAVTDNGIGIRSEHIPLLFRMFKRVHGSDRYPAAASTCRPADASSNGTTDGCGSRAAKAKAPPSPSPFRVDGHSEGRWRAIASRPASRGRR